MSSTMPGRLFIAGEWSVPRPDFASLSPSNRSFEVGRFPNATASEVKAAISAAKDAFPAWKALGHVRRGEFFDRLARLIADEVDDLAALMAYENGKILSECRAEIIEGLHMVQYVFGTSRMPTGQVIPSEIPEKDVTVRRKPWGVVGVITPWNFPFAVPLWMLGPSLLEGNTAVFKPSEDTPAVGQRLVELFTAAGFPKGVLNLVHGAGEVGERIVQDARVNVVLFTGSSEVGMHIQKESAKFHDRTVAAEMGGKNAVVVCQDADLELAVKASILSAFKTTGQRCVSASRIIVHSSLYKPFLERFAAIAAKLKFGDPFATDSFAGPLIHPEAVEKVLTYNALAAKEADDVVLAGRRTGDCFLTPQVYGLRYNPLARVLREEVFGPHVAVVPFESDEEGVQIANATDYGLSLAVISESYRRHRLYREECDYGMGYVNLPCIGAEVHLPFGGVKKSGNGHPSAAWLVQAVTHPVAWTVNCGNRIVMAQGLPADI
jgi:aldehyde dehydrogenase (NAD+)